MSKRVIAVVVNHNRRELLLRSLESLQRQVVKPSRIVLVDNLSTDGSAEAVRQRFDDVVEVVHLAENIGSAGGFCHGLDAAISSSDADVLLLDSDVVLAPDCVGELAALLAGNENRGVVGPKVYKWDSEIVLQEFGGWIDWNTADLRRNCWRHDETVSGAVGRNCEVDYVPACCLLARRSAIEKAGNFDPGWFLYWDDVDWCSRIRRAGFSIEAVSSARVQHFGGGANKTSLLPVYYGWRNRAVYFIRNTPVEEREKTLRALFNDFLLARFTCRSLGLPKTAGIMEMGIDDAMNGVFGKKNFSRIDLSLDETPQKELDSAEVVEVHHVIGSATAELAWIPGAIISDRFGKRMPAARAFELRKQFEATDLPTLNDWVSRGLDRARATE